MLYRAESKGEDWLLDQKRQLEPDSPTPFTQVFLNWLDSLSKESAVTLYLNVAGRGF